MRPEANRYKTVTRRAALLAGGQAALFAVLAGRMYYLQVIEADQYKMLAEENRINLRLLSPPRGRILDRFGEELAGNQQNYRVLLIPEQTASVEEALLRLAKLIPVAEHDRRRVLREARRKRGFVPITVSENLTWEQFARINVHSPDLPGVQPDVGETRHYPHRDAFAHVVGYVGAVAVDELGTDPLLELPGFRIGKSGIERTLDLDLRGKAGNSRVEVNAYGRVIRELTRRHGQPGREVVLTLDAGLQRHVAGLLTGESAAGVVLDIHTGDVLALVSMPSFDPNAFNYGLSHGAWRSLVGNPKNPLVNKAIAGQYPPGSTFKMIVALAALESGIISPEQSFFCSGSLKLGDRRFHCWKRGGHGEMALVTGIEQSCDVYFFEVAKRVGVDRVAEMARRFGLGTKLGIDLAAEKSGLIPTRAWKAATLGQPWQQGETLNTGIGQGYVLATPLQLAIMTARLGNGGKAVLPRLVRSSRDRPGSALEDAPPAALGIAQRWLALVHEAMVRVSNSPRGTAYRARVPFQDFQMASKTGTSQVRRISQQERRRLGDHDNEKPWQERDHASFVAYAPAHEPRYAVAVVVEHGGSGARKAAPIVRDIVLEIRRRDPLRQPPYGGMAGLPAAPREG